MSRFDGPTEPDFDRYAPKPHDPQDDLDVPDFDQPDIDGGESWTDVAYKHMAQYQKSLHDPSFTISIDPAEHAMHALIDALTTLEQQIVLAPSLERLNALRQLTKRAEQHATLVNNKCADAIDRAMERIR
jgi:hypothetical protein